MATLLGSPYERGQSDVIVSRKPKESIKIDEGLFVADSGEGTVALVGAGVPFGVMGQQEMIGCSVVCSGMQVYCQTDDEADFAVGAQVFVLPNGKVTSTASGAKPTRATFAEANAKTNGIANNTTNKFDVRCVAINMVGGV